MSTNYSNKKSPTKDPEDWISQAEAARIREVSRQAIAKLVKQGRLRTFTIGGRTLVNRTDVIEFSPKNSGRKKVKGNK